MYEYLHICMYHFLADYYVVQQCKSGASCRARRELSNALLKRYFRLTDVEIWPSFRNAPAPVTGLIVILCISVTKRFQYQFTNSLFM